MCFYNLSSQLHVHQAREERVGEEEKSKESGEEREKLEVTQKQK
jgi:hypothetical protein